VLLDIVMPGLSGYEVCRQLRAQESTRDLPVMFLSSLEDVKDKTARVRGRRERLPHETLRGG